MKSNNKFINGNLTLIILTGHLLSTFKAYIKYLKTDLINIRIRTEVFTKELQN